MIEELFTKETLRLAKCNFIPTHTSININAGSSESKEIKKMCSPTFAESKHAPLGALLRGRGCLWHRTSLQSLEHILSTQSIIPNKDKVPFTHGASKISYGHHLGAVCLFDFDSSDEACILKEEWKWGTVLNQYLPDVGVVIGIQRQALDPEKLLLPADIAGSDRRICALPDKIRNDLMVLPAVEALHIGPIPTSAFSTFILSAFKDGGGYHLYENKFETDVLRTLRAVSNKWITKYFKDTAARQARGQTTAAEKLKAAIMSLNDSGINFKVEDGDAD